MGAGMLWKGFLHLLRFGLGHSLTPSHMAADPVRSGGHVEGCVGHLWCL